MTPGPRGLVREELSGVGGHHLAQRRGAVDGRGGRRRRANTCARSPPARSPRWWSRRRRRGPRCTSALSFRTAAFTRDDIDKITAGILHCIDRSRPELDSTCPIPAVPWRRSVPALLLAAACVLAAAAARPAAAGPRRDRAKPAGHSVLRSLTVDRARRGPHPRARSRADHRRRRAHARRRARRRASSCCTAASIPSTWR